MSRPRRPLPPLPTTQATAYPAHQAQNTPAVRASQTSDIPVVKNDAHRSHGAAEDYSCAHSPSRSGLALRRRGTLFATDGPIPDDFEAPPPFHAIDADRPAFPVIARPRRRERERERVAYESPPPSPLETSFPNTSQQLPPLQSTPFYSTSPPVAHLNNPPARPISPYPRQGSQQHIVSSPAHVVGHTRTHSWQPQPDKPMFDPTSFYSAAVSAQLAPAPRQPTRMASTLSHQSHSSVSYSPRNPPARPSG